MYRRAFVPRLARKTADIEAKTFSAYDVATQSTVITDIRQTTNEGYLSFSTIELRRYSQEGRNQYIENETLPNTHMKIQLKLS